MMDDDDDDDENCQLGALVSVKFVYGMCVCECLGRCPTVVEPSLSPPYFSYPCGCGWGPTKMVVPWERRSSHLVGGGGFHQVSPPPLLL